MNEDNELRMQRWLDHLENAYACADDRYTIQRSANTWLVFVRTNSFFIKFRPYEMHPNKVQVAVCWGIGNSRLCTTEEFATAETLRDVADHLLNTLVTDMDDLISDECKN